MPVSHQGASHVDGSRVQTAEMALLPVVLRRRVRPSLAAALCQLILLCGLSSVTAFSHTFGNKHNRQSGLQQSS